MLKAQSDEQRLQLAEQRRKVDFDTYDISVDELLRRVEHRRIDVAPVYQRQFRWDAARQSRLVESVFLGIPVPPLFMATNTSSDAKSTWEVVDGLQRLLTLASFMAPDQTRSSLGLAEAPLKLEGLEKLTKFNGVTFRQLAEDLRTTLQDRPFKVVVLNDKSEIRVRFDLFERLNTGGISLSPQEIRECVYRGEFTELLGELAATPAFKTVVVLPESKQKDGTSAEFVLRFFAFLEGYETFEHSVKGFLDSFMQRAHESPRRQERQSSFARTFAFLSTVLGHGLKTRKGQTPVNLFEAVAVGAALALDSVPHLRPPTSLPWLGSAELRRLTTGATNSRSRVVGRIEYCRDAFLANDAQL